RRQRGGCCKGDTEEPKNKAAPQHRLSLLKPPTAKQQSYSREAAEGNDRSQRRGRADGGGRLELPRGAAPVFAVKVLLIPNCTDFVRTRPLAPNPTMNPPGKGRNFGESLSSPSDWPPRKASACA